MQNNIKIPIKGNAVVTIDLSDTATVDRLGLVPKMRVPYGIVNIYRDGPAAVAMLRMLVGLPEFGEVIADIETKLSAIIPEFTVLTHYDINKPVVIKLESNANEHCFAVRIVGDQLKTEYLGAKGCLNGTNTTASQCRK